mmetsp:Transcript_247/g.329  ORF Transcript_247/g.329 Transcript_247/m.329 type:complete len:94 (+) Transcript_247:93-374(+)
MTESSFVSCSCHRIMVLKPGIIEGRKRLRRKMYSKYVSLYYVVPVQMSPLFPYHLIACSSYQCIPLKNCSSSSSGNVANRKGVIAPLSGGTNP